MNRAPAIPSQLEKFPEKGGGGGKFPEIKSRRIDPKSVNFELILKTTEKKYKE
jgi:hypothetical protein